MNLSEKIHACLSRFSGGIGLYYLDLADKEFLEINSKKIFSAASVIKIPLAMLASELVFEGKYCFDQKIAIKDANRVGGTGVIQILNHDYVPTIRELIELALSVSDNIATNELIDLVGGTDAVTKFCEDHGLGAIKLQRKMMDMEAKNQGRDNWITAHDIGILLEEICENYFGADESLRCKVTPILTAMVRQQCRNKIPAKIPASDYYGLDSNFTPPPGEVVVANKTGDLWTTQNDVGICIMPDGRKYILVILTNELKHGVDGIELISEISKTVYRHMLSKQTNGN